MAFWDSFFTPPKSPDYAAAARQDTRTNRPNQTNAIGATTTWSTEPVAGPGGLTGNFAKDFASFKGYQNAKANARETQTTSVAPELQGAVGGLLGQANANLSTPMDWNQFGTLGNGDTARDQAIDAAYGQATKRLDPQWASRAEAQRTQLMNMGLDPNSEAAKEANMDLGNARNDAYTSAMNAAIGQGTAAGNSVFQNNLASRQQMMAEALKQRGQPLDELGQLNALTGQAGFNQGGSALDAAGLQGQADWNAWNAKNAAKGGLINGGLGVVKDGAQMAIMASDERFKTAIVRHAEEALPGVPVATWEYRGLPGLRFRGVIAQDLEKVAPAYVHKDARGFRFVDYSFAKGQGHESR